MNHFAPALRAVKIVAGLFIGVGFSSATFGQIVVTTPTLIVGPGGTLNVPSNVTLNVLVSTYLGTGSLVVNDGIINTGGTVNGDNGSVFNFSGSGVFNSLNATFILESSKAFNIAGTLTITSGVKFDLTGLTLPGFNGAVQTETIPLGVDGAIVGEFDLPDTTVLGLGNPSGATLIAEAAGEGSSFNPATDSVYWVQEAAGNISLKYSIAPVPAPEPASALLLLGGGALLALRRRRSGARALRV